MYSLRRDDTVLGKIGSYAIAFVVLAVVEFPFSPITIALSMAFRKVKWLSPIVTALFDAIKICLAILFASWLIDLVGESPAWLMFLIPGYLMCQNDIMRINRVKAGHSKVKFSLEKNGEAESYDQKLDLWTERAHLIGDVTGWIVGMNLILQPAAFF